MEEHGTPDLSGSLLPDRLQYSLKVQGHGLVQLDLELDPRLQVPDVEIDGKRKGSKKGKSKDVSCNYQFTIMIFCNYFFTKIKSIVLSMYVS